MRQLVSIFLSLLVSVFGVGAVWAQGASELVLSASPTQISPGERVEVVLEIKSAGGGNVSIGNVSIPGTDGWRLVGNSTQTSVRSINGQSMVSTLVKQTYVVPVGGTFTLGPATMQGVSGESNTVVVNVRTGNSGQVTAPTATPTVPATNTPSLSNVVGTVSVTPAPTEAPRVIKDTRAAESVAATQGEEWNSSLIVQGAILVIVAGLMLYLWRRYKQYQGPVGDRAAEILSEPVMVWDISSQDLDTAADVKAATMKYVHRKYGIATGSKTTEEVIRELQKKKVTEVFAVERLLRDCDKARFGGSEEAVEKLREEYGKLVG